MKPLIKLMFSAGTKSGITSSIDTSIASITHHYCYDLIFRPLFGIHTLQQVVYWNFR